MTDLEALYDELNVGREPRFAGPKYRTIREPVFTGIARYGEPEPNISSPSVETVRYDDLFVVSGVPAHHLFQVPLSDTEEAAVELFKTKWAEKIAPHLEGVVYWREKPRLHEWPDLINGALSFYVTARLCVPEGSSLLRSWADTIRRDLTAA